MTIYWQNNVNQPASLGIVNFKASSLTELVERVVRGAEEVTAAGPGGPGVSQAFSLGVFSKTDCRVHDGLGSLVVIFPGTLCLIEDQ
jgi:hypothetical protein